MSEVTSEKKYRWLIVTASIAIPIVIAMLYLLPKGGKQGVDFSFLPLLNASLNGLTTIMLILGLISIKRGNKIIHRRFMTTAIALSIMFLLSYILYHSTTEPTGYGGEGVSRYVYFFLLITHISLAIVIVPLVLVTYVRALSEKFDKHKKIARITWPIWMYVCITGVIVYLLLSPYY